MLAHHGLSKGRTEAPSVSRIRSLEFVLFQVQDTRGAVGTQIEYWIVSLRPGPADPRRLALSAFGQSSKATPSWRKFHLPRTLGRIDELPPREVQPFDRVSTTNR